MQTVLRLEWWRCTVPALEVYIIKYNEIYIKINELQ